MKKDMNSEKVNAAFAGNNDLAEKIQVNGVPTLIMNGEMLQPAAPYIQAKIEEARK